MLRKETGQPWSWSESGPFVGCGLSGRRRLTFHLPVVLDEDAVEEDRDGTRMDERLALPDGLMEDDVVDLPLARLALRVHERRILGIDGARLAVGIVLDELGLALELLAGVVALEHLHLVAKARTHQEDAGIAAHLRVVVDRLDVGRVLVVDVQLAVTELLAGRARAELEARTAGERAFFLVDDPLRRITLAIRPVLLKGSLGAIEKDDCVGRHALLVDCHAGRLRTIPIVDRPRVLFIRRIAIKAGEDRHRRENESCNSNFFHLFLPFEGNLTRNLTLQRLVYQNKR